MKGYGLRIPDSVVEMIRGMHPHLKRKIRLSIQMILNRPEEGKDLRFELSGLRSFRVSRFRIIYSVRVKTVEIVAIGPRTLIYQETLRLLRNKPQQHS